MIYWFNDISETNKFRSEQRCAIGFFPEIGRMIVEMGMIRGPQESLVSIFTWSSIFPNHLEQISNILKECVTD